MTKAILAGALTASVLAGCGGSGGSGTPLSDGADGLCAEPFFQRIVGDYEGLVTYGREIDSAPEERLCEWDMRVAVRPESSLSGICRIEAVIMSEMRQSVVYPAGDDRAYQCVSPDGLLGLHGPHDTTNPMSLADATTPVFYGYFGGLSAPARGPYFGDESAIVPYVQLFTGTNRIVESLRFDGGGELELFRNPDPTTTRTFEAILERVDR